MVMPTSAVTAVGLVVLLVVVLVLVLVVTRRFVTGTRRNVALAAVTLLENADTTLGTPRSA